MKVEIKDYERVDDLHRNGYMLIQDPKRFCFGVDAVLLSGFATAKKGDKVLDLGTGTGVIPILMSAKTKAEHFSALEIQPESAEMAKRSVMLNDLQDKIDIIEGDIKKAAEIFKPSSFDVITTNPPYMNFEGGIKNSYDPKTIARHEVLCSLDDVAFAAQRLLKFGGRFFMVHRPHRLTDIMCVLREHKLEPKRIRFVQPYADREPNMVLVEAVRSGKPMIKVMPTLVIYNSDGTYTQETLDIYYN